MKICENCGTISEFSEGKCKNCNNSKIVDLGKTTEEWFRLNSNQKESIIKTVLSLSDETYDIIQEAWRNNKKCTQTTVKSVSSHSSQQNIPKCPTCGSTNVHPISAGKKAVGFLTVGVFSKNFGKSYECDDCKYKW